MKLILLPGMDGTGDLFGPLLQALPRRLEPVVVRYPNNEPLTYRELEEYVRSYLPTNEQYVIVGESFSGPIAISLSASNPRRLVSLILCCSFARNPHPKFAALKSLIGIFPSRGVPSMLASFVLLGSESNEERQSELESALTKVAPEVIRMRLREVLAVDVTSKLAEIASPIMYMRATRDRIVPKSALEEIREHAPRIHVVEIDGPHFLLQAKATSAAAEIDRFVTERSIYKGAADGH
jgi:pimeloyl-ACP methyl ester carboxylesterase